MKVMKKYVKVFFFLLVVAGMIGLCGATSSCSSSGDAPMYRTYNHNTSKVIKSKYKVKGTNRSNSATYRSF
ncbi:MAG: hypothetical protein IJR13_02260 [Bacteroidales bacterium]|nr:hypothetical protein [Bacteroidales bacterium]